MKLSPVQKLAVTVAAALLVLGLFAAVSYYYASRLVAADRAVERANASIAEAYRIVVATRDAERATKAYVIRPDSSARAQLADAQSRVEDALDVMRKSSEDNPREANLLHDAAHQVSQAFDAFRTTTALRDRVGADSARRVLTRDFPAAEADSLLKLVSGMRDEELRVLAEQARMQSASGENAQRIILIGMVITFLLAGLALQPVRADVAKRLTSRIVSAETGLPDAAAAASAQATATALQLETLHQLVAALAEAHEPSARARALVDAGVPALNAALCAVIAPDGAGGFTVLASSNPAFTAVSAELARPVADALRTGEAVLVESRAERERTYGTLAALDTHGAAGAVLFVPMPREDAITGVILAAAAADHVYRDDELLFAATIGRLGGTAVAARSTSL